MFLNILAPHAAEYSITQIANENLINQSPQISETGLAAWTVVERSETHVASDIFVYYDGSSRNLTMGALGDLSANVHPQVQGNSVVWTTAFTNRPSADKFTWQLQEVSNRDDVQEGLDIDGYWVVEAGGGKEQNPEQQRMIPFAEALTNRPPPPPSTTGVATQVQLPPLKDPAGQGRYPSGNNEICSWTIGEEPERLTTDIRNDLAPGFYEDVVAWQKAKGWPFGWEIMALNGENRYQLTTNFYYDMAPKVHMKKITWYGWDGHDFEIFLHDADQGGTLQITSNQFDDVSPVIWDGVVAWEAYPAVEADIFMWKNGKIQKLSDNIEDDFNPRIWNGQVVWQGFDGDDFEIYLYNGTNTVKLTSNIHDDVNPDIRDGLICWMGYHDNWDPEIYAWNNIEIIRLTDNDYEDADPKTASGRIIWSAKEDEKSYIFLAEPKK